MTGEGEKILIVANDFYVRKILSTFLEKAGVGVSSLVGASRVLADIESGDGRHRVMYVPKSRGGSDQ